MILPSQTQASPAISQNLNFEFADSDRKVILCTNSNSDDDLSVEVQKYPYCAKPNENNDYLSEKICYYTIRIRKKIVRKTKRVFVYGQLISSLGNGLAPTQATLKLIAGKNAKCRCKPSAHNFV